MLRELKAGCGIFEETETGALLLIGERIEHAIPGESGIRIGRELVEKALSGPLSRILLWLGW